MLHIPVLRWGEPYTSMEVDEVVHFATGEPIAEVSRANGGLIQRDMRKAQRARDVLREIPIDELIARVGKAGELYMNADAADGRRHADARRVRARAVGDHRPARAHVPREHEEERVRARRDAAASSTSLTRGLVLDILSRGYGEERGVPISYQAQSPVLGLVLPSNSPGVHTLWLPVIPLQIGLVLKPGPQEPWTPYRMAEAFFQAGIPREAISIYPGGGDVGAAVLDSCDRSLIFGGTRDRRAVPRQPARAGARPRLLEDPARRRRGRQLGEVPRPDGRQRVRQQRPRLHQLLRHLGAAGTRARSPRRSRKRLAAVRPLPPDDPEASLAAFTVPGSADAISQAIDADLQGAGRHRRDRDVSRRPAPGQGGTRRLPAADGRPLRRRRTRRSRRRNTCSRSSRWSSARRRRCSTRSARRWSARAITSNPTFRRRADRRRAHRPAEPRPGADDPAQLAAAARRQHRRVPVPGAGVPDGDRAVTRHDWRMRAGR